MSDLPSEKLEYIDVWWHEEKIRFVPESKIKEARADERARIIEWGSEHCITHHTRMNNVLHRDCNECWANLKKGEL